MSGEDEYVLKGRCGLCVESEAGRRLRKQWLVWGQVLPYWFVFVLSPSPFPATIGQALDRGGVETEAGLRQKLSLSLTQSPGLVFPEWGQRGRRGENFLH